MFMYSNKPSGNTVGKPRIKYTFEMAEDLFKNQNLVLLEKEYKNSTISMKFICPNHPDIIQKKTLNNLLSQGSGCRLCNNERHRGINHESWKGGISSLNTYLREFIVKWKKDSMNACNYKCILTGEKFDVIHHLYSFNKIVSEAFQETCLPIYSEIGEYTEDQLTMIKQKLLEIHYRYPLGICLSRDIHNIYHKLYGDDNTPEQFEEFKQRYNNGEFNTEIIAS